ncbi:3'(2'),5'-bisphosphate nucleotidase CysQ [Methylonatrum kenyense]|uniref:3'(2'),5'-bisphosphate nucleotidase CysQ n=1 Tax=Methylonatrum kenyense TaxID=455253 RepID=UPI0020BE0D4D|nr:3'(2'),5'-bisphosphate nucleotidase CysQ [Methylonatrum kenyense]MCK8516229.1 3'(2'),5'-bisphosphate nucleotidase CysQ [Methylonatrum kenyense]
MPTIPFDEVIALAREAGDAILAVYNGSDFDVEAKADESPLTAADRASHRVIEAGIRRLTPEIPLLSEEGRDIPYAERRAWDRFWLVDPLDGTKEFIKRNGEFTVNIALIEKGRPVWGVIVAPALDAIYVGMVGDRAWVQHAGGSRKALQVRAPAPGEGHAVVKSRSHPSGELAAFLDTIQVADSVPVGSSLKFCAVAEGRATLYPRFGPTMEWDTGAGQAIVEAAGGKVVLADGSREPLRYNKESLLNPYFLVGR